MNISFKQVYTDFRDTSARRFLVNIDGRDWYVGYGIFGHEFYYMDPRRARDYPHFLGAPARSAIPPAVRAIYQLTQ